MSMRDRAGTEMNTNMRVLKHGRGMSRWTDDGGTA